MTALKPAEREAWILSYLEPRQAMYVGTGTSYHVDVLNADFVWAYAEATSVRVSVQFYGAPKCPTLGDDLGRMYRRAALDRVRTALGEGSRNLGFPPWVWCYSIPKSRWPSLKKPSC